MAEEDIPPIEILKFRRLEAQCDMWSPKKWREAEKEFQWHAYSKGILVKCKKETVSNRLPQSVRKDFTPLKYKNADDQDFVHLAACDTCDKIFRLSSAGKSFTTSNLKNHP